MILCSLIWGTPQKRNYLQKGRSFVIYASPCWVSALGNCLYQCTSWSYKRLLLASVNFFEDSFNMFAHFMMGYLRVHLPISCCVQQFWAKNWHNPHPPPSLFTQSRPKQLCLCFPNEKSPQRVTCCWCGRDETKKNGRSTKRHQNRQIKKKLFWAVEKMSQ